MNKTKDIDIVLNKFKQKTIDAIALVEASLLRVKTYNPEKAYTPEEREPYDALCDRFIRAVELSIKFFKSYEMKMFAENSETLRDLILRMEKMNMVSSLDIWFQMRDVRNRIVHNYLPEAIQLIYFDITHPFADELKSLKEKVTKLHI